MKQINETKIGRIMISKDECNTYDEYLNMPHSHINRPGTADEYVSFNTINLSDLEDVAIYKISQISIYGDFLCDFGFFTTREEAEENMLNGFEKLYKGFKDECHRTCEYEWISDQYEFIVHIERIELNTFGEL